MENLNVFLTQNSDVQLLSDTTASQRKGGRRFVTSNYREFVSMWGKLHQEGLGHDLCYTYDATHYCLEW